MRQTCYSDKISLKYFLFLLLLMAAASQLAFSQGKIVYVDNSGPDSEIWMMNDDGTGKERLTFMPGDQWHPKFSPDGSRIAFNNGENEIWILEVDTGNSFMLTERPSGVRRMLIVDWGKSDWIYYVRDTSSTCWNEEFWRIRPDGTGDSLVVVDRNHFGAETYDGSRFVYAKSYACWTPRNELRIVDVDGSNNQLIQASDGRAEYYPGTANTSSVIAFTEAPGPNPPRNLFLINEDGSGKAQVTGYDGSRGGFYGQPSFSPDDLYVAMHYTDPTTELSDVVKVNLADGSFVTLADGPGQQYQADWSPARSIPLDIKPGSCPNPIALNKTGNLPAAILGTLEIDVNMIDPSTILLNGVPAIRWSYEDVATPFEPYLGKEECFEDCWRERQDGIFDLTLKFDAQAVLASLGEVEPGECRVLKVTGQLYSGEPFVGEDVVIIRDN